MAEAKRPRLDEAGLAEAPEEDGLESLDDPTVQALQEADALQQQLEQINDEASDRVLAVEQEFNLKRRPVYAQRNAALAKIPGFWKRVLMVHPIIRGVVTEADLDIMDYLVEVDVEDYEDIKSGYRLKFTFAEGNPFFSNRVLTKELRFADDASLTTTGTAIQWHPGMEPAAEEDGQAGSKRRLENSANQYMLFKSWFNEQQQVEMGHDEVADVLKDDIWPDPMRWFREAEEGGALFEADGEGELDEFEDEYEDGAADEGEEGDGVEYVAEGEEVYEAADEGEEEDEGEEPPEDGQ